MDDKRETKMRVLEAACEVFAEKGYRDATVQEICVNAKANIAAVNYYFGSKEQLYMDVWQEVLDRFRSQYSVDIAEIDDAGERLRQMIHQRIRHAFDDGPAGRMRKIIHREMGDPSEMHAEIMERFMQPFVMLLVGTVAEIIGTDPADVAAHRCAFSIHSQIVFLNIMRLKCKTHHIEMLLESASPSEEQIDEMAEHVITFAMGGMKAVAESRAIDGEKDPPQALQAGGR
ncbi:MAG: CerR family C-terminal domain-containing protein [Kiritimatiellae bacterium]|nr:CerR family C-terminal domain-containing protein [Kiritimatiellia bacterium]